LLVATDTNLRIRVPEEMAKQLDGLVEDKHITKQDVYDALLRMLLDQDDLTQSMLLGQVKPAPELIEIVLKRLAAAKGKRRLAVRDGNSVGFR
jgi:hypothetical protein